MTPRAPQTRPLMPRKCVFAAPGRPAAPSRRGERNHRASRPRALREGAWLVPKGSLVAARAPLLPACRRARASFPLLLRPRRFVSADASLGPLVRSSRGEMENGAPQRGRGGPARVTKTPDGRTVQSFRSHPIYGFVSNPPAASSRQGRGAPRALPSSSCEGTKPLLKKGRETCRSRFRECILDARVGGSLAVGAACSAL